MHWPGPPSGLALLGSIGRLDLCGKAGSGQRLVRFGMTERLFPAEEVLEFLPGLADELAMLAAQPQ